MSSSDARPLVTRWSHAGHTMGIRWSHDGRPMVTRGARSMKCSCWSQNRAVRS